MKQLVIAVIGANGRTGRVFVEAALAHDHRVRAGVHGGDLPKQNNLEVFKVDATNLDQVSRLLEGCDAVVSLIGHVKGSQHRVQTEAINTILDAMSTQNVTRLVSLTGNGVRMPGDRITLIDLVLNAGIKMFDPARIQDGVEHAEVMQDSSADWTLVRVLKLTNGGVQAYGLSERGPARLFTSRATVAAAIVEILEKDLFVHQSPIISK